MVNYEILDSGLCKLESEIIFLKKAYIFLPLSISSNDLKYHFFVYIQISENNDTLSVM